MNLPVGFSGDRVWDIMGRIGGSVVNFVKLWDLGCFWSAQQVFV